MKLCKFHAIVTGLIIYQRCISSMHSMEIHGFIWKRSTNGVLSYWRVARKIWIWYLENGSLCPPHLWQFYLGKYDEQWIYVYPSLRQTHMKIASDGYSD